MLSGLKPMSEEPVDHLTGAGSLHLPSAEELTGPPIFVVKSEVMPWAIRVYIGLFVMFLVLLLVAVFSTWNMPTVPDTHPSAKLFSFATDGLKTVLGALLGSLSLATEHYFRRERTSPKPSG